MKPITFLLCFAAATFGATVLQAQQQPKFQSLTPGAQQRSASWVNHLNAMHEAERQRRVQTYGMPAAPPNRWIQQRQRPPQSAPPASSTPRQFSQRLPQQAPPRAPQPPRQRPQTSAPSHPSFPPSIYQTSQARPVAATPTPAKPRIIRASVKSRPAPKREKSQLRVTVVRPRQTKAPAQVKVAPKPVAKAYPVAWKPKTPPKATPAALRQASIRRELAYMPSTTSGRNANPWAPYQSRAEYQHALKRSKWQPRGPVARAPQQRPASKPRRWGFKSWFKRSTPRKQKTPRRASEPKQERMLTAPKVPSSTYVTSGLPQDNRSGSVIETTLFGR